MSPSGRKTTRSRPGSRKSERTETPLTPTQLARRAKLSAMKGAFQLGITEIKQEAEADRAARAAQAALEYVELKQGVNDAWDSGKWDECKQALDKCLELNGDSDVLHNYRARVFDKKDMVREMVEDAKRAVELWSCTENLLLLSRCLQEAKKHSESGQNYLHASDRGDGSMPQITEGYNGLLKTIRRDRGFFNGGPAKPEKVLDMDAAFLGAKPDPPELYLSSIKPEGVPAIVARWEPNTQDEPASIVE